MANGEGRVSWRLSLLCLVGLGLLFYSSYGFSNWLASTRADVPSVVFGWESHIGFIAWMIVPYWTTNLFYAVSFFLCRTCTELLIHVKRLLTAQIISVACFILFPLKFSLQKPDTSGAFGFLYDSLALFDKPFNQAPSLHVALTVILAALYIRVLPRRLAAAFLGWSLLVILSVLTTYQHHFIDIPTGFLLGLFCVWLWPADGRKRKTSWASGHRLALAAVYAAGACLLAAIAFHFGGALLWLLWPAVAALAVAMGYLWLGTEIFDKGADGRIGWPSRIVLLPYRLVARLNARLWTRNDARSIVIADNVHLGRFPAAKDLQGFATVIDLTGEFHRPDAEIAWIAIPMLDLASPAAPALAAAADAIEQARSKGPVLVVCALGYGRSVAVLATWLLRSGRAKDIDAAIATLRRLRPKMRLSAMHIGTIGKAQHEKNS